MTPARKAKALEAGEPAEYRFFSEDLALSLVQPPLGKVEPLEAPPLAPGASEKTLYVRRRSPCCAAAAPSRARYDQARGQQWLSGAGVSRRS